MERERGDTSSGVMGVMLDPTDMDSANAAATCESFAMDSASTTSQVEMLAFRAGVNSSGGGRWRGCGGGGGVEKGSSRGGGGGGGDGGGGEDGSGDDPNIMSWVISMAPVAAAVVVVGAANCTAL